MKHDKYKDIILDSLKYLVQKRRIILNAFVIMNNHMHLIWQIVEPNELAAVQRDFLKFTAQSFLNIMSKDSNYRLKDFRSDLKDRMYQIWEKKAFWVELKYPEKYFVKLEYIHNNPLAGKWKLAETILDYKWSSAKFHEGEKQDFEFLKVFDI